jgi:hypothetical protein
MGIKCMIGAHDWHGCKCQECGKMRHTEHKLEGGGACGKCRKCGRMIHTLAECTHEFWQLRPHEHAHSSTEAKVVLQSLKLTDHLAGRQFDAYALASVDEALALYDSIIAAKGTHQMPDAITFTTFGPASQDDAHASNVGKAWVAINAHFELRRLGNDLYGVFLTQHTVQEYPAEG